MRAICIILLTQGHSNESNTGDWSGASSSYDTLPELDYVISAASSGSRNTTPVFGLVLPYYVLFISL